MRKDRKLVATKYVGIKGRWHFRAWALSKRLIKFNFHWDWLIHLAHVLGSDHRKKPVVYYKSWIRPLMGRYKLKEVKLDVKI